jgi:hypothetical protein
MKQLILLAFIWICGNVSAQIEVTQHTIYTVSRDTLYIVNNPTGRLIYSAWNSTPVKNTERLPVIIIVDDLEEVRKKYTTQKNKNKKP